MGSLALLLVAAAAPLVGSDYCIGTADDSLRQRPEYRDTKWIQLAGTLNCGRCVPAPLCVCTLPLSLNVVSVCVCVRVWVGVRPSVQPLPRRGQRRG